MNGHAQLLLYSAYRAWTYECVVGNSLVGVGIVSYIDSILIASLSSLQMLDMLGLFIPSNWTHAIAISATFHTDDKLYPFPSRSSTISSIIPRSYERLACTWATKYTSNYSEWLQSHKVFLVDIYPTHSTIWMSSFVVSLNMGSCPLKHSRRTTPKLNMSTFSVKFDVNAYL